MPFQQTATKKKTHIPSPFTLVQQGNLQKHKQGDTMTFIASIYPSFLALGALVSHSAECSVPPQWPITAEEQDHLEQMNHIHIWYVIRSPQIKPIIG